ncbi:alpha/beta hydrolase [Microbacterium elymi]|uniref:Alpha/beta hydrolase n=1 Tax=Microbacterium elymi TaxID=2909587 RepID=A0ABY5NLW0_9MICO|nr:alpha/beta hydrolase [Microbacterium elymi]UUT36157.1 alpha/beta hydrolase [Microbacterium elymi]
MRDSGDARLLAQVLVYPVLHAEHPAPDAELAAMLAELPFGFSSEQTQAINANYLGDASPGEMYAFPGGHDLRRVAPALIVAADGDDLRPSAEAYVGDLARSGVDVEYVRQPGATHGFLNMIGDASALHTVDRIARYLCERAEGAGI